MRCVLILEYIGYNFMTLLILILLVVFIISNKGERIPATNLFRWAVVVILILTVNDYITEKLSNTTLVEPFTMEHDKLIALHTLFSTFNYILRPLVILLQLLIVAPGKKVRLLCVLPAVLNTAIYISALFGNRRGFYYDEANYFHGGELNLTIFIVQIVYVSILAVFSVYYFQKDDIKRSLMLILILLITITAVWLEYSNLITGFATPVAALCTLSYYVYLSLIYQQEIRKSIAEKELTIVKKQMVILRDQIQPHFVYNCLNIIRTLSRTDSEAAVRTIDDFTEYLQAHFRVVKEDKLIPFEQEMENVRVFLSLATTDHSKSLDIEYDLNETDFELPLLCLEPIVENAVKHGAAKEHGVIRISTFAEEQCYKIVVYDNGGTGNAGMTQRQTSRISVGISNVRERLASLCGGSLEIRQTENSTSVYITIPKEMQQ